MKILLLLALLAAPASAAGSPGFSAVGLSLDVRWHELLGRFGHSHHHWLGEKLFEYSFWPGEQKPFTRDQEGGTTLVAVGQDGSTALIDRNQDAGVMQELFFKSTGTYTISADMADYRDDVCYVDARLAGGKVQSMKILLCAAKSGEGVVLEDYDKNVDCADKLAPLVAAYGDPAPPVESVSEGAEGIDDGDPGVPGHRIETISWARDGQTLSLVCEQHGDEMQATQILMARDGAEVEP